MKTDSGWLWNSLKLCCYRVSLGWPWSHCSHHAQCVYWSMVSRGSSGMRHWPSVSLGLSQMRCWISVSFGLSQAGMRCCQHHCQGSVISVSVCTAQDAVDVIGTG